MSEHLPECPAPLCDWGLPDGECMGYEDCHHLCCCGALRACEARVRHEGDVGPNRGGVHHELCGCDDDEPFCEPEKCPYCSCWRLRACEQRVEAEWLDRYNYDPDLVWEDALDVARQAVKEICQQNPLIWPTDEAAMQALDAAIDVLKEGGTKEYKVRSTWSAALDAAREAVLALPHYRAMECDPGLMPGKHDDSDPWLRGYLVDSDEALAAIDELREGTK